MASKKDNWTTMYKNARILFFVNLLGTVLLIWIGLSNSQMSKAMFLLGGASVITLVLWFAVWRLFKSRSSAAIPVGYTFFTLFLLSNVASLIFNPGIGTGVGVAIGIYFLVITYKAHQQQKGAASSQPTQVG